MSTREKRFSILPGCSRLQLDSFGDLRSSGDAVGAYLALVAVLGFFGSILLDLVKADRGAAAHGPEIVAKVGETSRLVVKGDDNQPTANAAPAVRTGCRP